MPDEPHHLLNFLRQDMKEAETVTGEFIVIVHVPVPEHAPDHPAKYEFLLGVAVSVTFTPALYVSEQTEPQLIPSGNEAMVPVPVPDLLTVMS